MTTAPLSNGPHSGFHTMYKVLHLPLWKIPTEFNYKLFMQF